MLGKLFEGLGKGIAEVITLPITVTKKIADKFEELSDD